MNHFLEESKILKDDVVYTFEQEEDYEGELAFVYINEETSTGFYLLASEIEERTELKFIHPIQREGRDILIPLTDYFTDEQLELYEKGKVSAEPSFPVLKLMGNTTIENKPDYGFHRVTEDEILQYLKGKVKLYTFDEDQTVYEFDQDNSISLLLELVEEDKIYVIKPF